MVQRVRRSLWRLILPGPWLGAVILMTTAGGVSLGLPITEASLCLLVVQVCVSQSHASICSTDNRVVHGLRHTHVIGARGTMSRALMACALG
jgi:hypothetical protein